MCQVTHPETLGLGCIVMITGKLYGSEDLQYQSKILSPVPT